MLASYRTDRVGLDQCFFHWSFFYLQTIEKCYQLLSVYILIVLLDIKLIKKGDVNEKILA